MKYKLTEIGFDTSIETKKSLIKIANEHCNSYNDRIKTFGKITTVSQAILYFTKYGFKVEIIED